MLPFLKIPVILAGKPEEQEEDKQVDACIQPGEIAAFQPGYYWGSFIYMKGGHVLCTPKTCEEIEIAIKDYWANVTRSKPILFQ